MLELLSDSLTLLLNKRQIFLLSVLIVKNILSHQLLQELTLEDYKAYNYGKQMSHIILNLVTLNISTLPLIHFQVPCLPLVTQEKRHEMFVDI